MAGEKAMLETAPVEPSTVKVALAAFTVPSTVARTLVVLTTAPGELLVTLTWTVQIEFASNSPSKLTLLEPTVATTNRLQRS